LNVFLPHPCSWHKRRGKDFSAVDNISFFEPANFFAPFFTYILVNTWNGTFQALRYPVQSFIKEPFQLISATGKAAFKLIGHDDSSRAKRRFLSQRMLFDIHRQFAI
ncbi:MAG: hypothetical protein ACLTBF_11415, partial [Christensenellales bacterium]